MAQIQTNDGRMHIAEPAHVNSAPKNLTAERAKEWATHSDILSIHPQQIKGFESIINDACTTMIYTKGCHDQDASFAESWYSHNRYGDRKANKHYTPVVNIMQPTSPWVGHHQTELLGLKSKYGWLESFFKDTVRASYDIGGPPVKPGTSVEYTRAEWNGFLKVMIDKWDAAVGYSVKCINGLVAADTAKQLTPCIGMIEAAFGTLDHTLPSLSQWINMGDQIVGYQKGGWTPWVYVKMNTTFNSPEWLRTRRFTMASSYLWDQGSLLYCIGSKEQTPSAADTQEYLHPWYRPSIGKPGAVTDWHQMLRPNGAYVRSFSSGRVIVNPTSEGIDVVLGDKSHHAIPAQDAAIIRKTSAGWVNV